MHQSFGTSVSSDTLSSQNCTTHKSSGSKWGTNPTPAPRSSPPEEVTAIINMELRSMWSFILQHCHGKFCTLSQGYNITAEKKEASVFCFGVSVCKHLNSLFKFSCCSYCSYKKVLHLSAPTWIHAHMQNWKEHTQAGSDWSQKFLNIYWIRSKQCYF